MAGQVDVVHNGWHRGQTTKRGRDATFGQKHLAKLSNSQTIASLFGQGENNCAPNQKKEYIIMKMKMSSRVHNVSDEVGLICMCTKPKCAKT